MFFLGTMEIQRCLDVIKTLPGGVNRYFALPLHASLLSSEQRRVFKPAPFGMRKIIVATNVAETSITIEDIVAVIDTGRVKETSYDHSNNVV
jgi:ATP-dependent RNA helicase DHX57